MWAPVLKVIKFSHIWLLSSEGALIHSSKLGWDVDSTGHSGRVVCGRGVKKQGRMFCYKLSTLELSMLTSSLRFSNPAVCCDHPLEEMTAMWPLA